MYHSSLRCRSSRSRRSTKRCGTWSAIASSQLRPLCRAASICTTSTTFRMVCTSLRGANSRSGSRTAVAPHALARSVVALARVPRAQTPAHDNQELVHSDWFRPQDVLDAFDREEMVLMTPTLRMVRSLARFGSADEVIAAASSNLPDERVRVVDGRLVLPGDPGYEHADQNIENGWVRLRPG